MSKPFIQNVNPPTPLQTELHLKMFNGGLNNKMSSPFLLDEGESPDLLNVIFNERGILKKRKGYIPFFNFTLGDTPEKIFIYEKRDGTKIYLICTATELHKINDDFISTTIIKTVANPIDGLTYQDKFLFVDGAGYYEYDGTTVTPIVNASYTPTANEIDDPFKGPNNIPQDCTLIELKEERIWLGGSASTPNTIYCTDLANYKYIPTNAFVPALTDDAQKVTAIKNYMNTLVIFKEDNVFILYGNNPDILNGVDPFSLKKTNAPSGTLSPKSVKRVESFLYYLGTNGNIYSLYPVKTDIDYIATKNISEKVNIFNDPINFSSSDLNKCSATYFEGVYYLSLNAGKILVFDYINQAFTVFDGLFAKDFIIDDYQLLFISTRLKIYKFGEGFDDDGNIIKAYWTSKLFDFGFPRYLKQFRKLYVISEVILGCTNSMKLTFLVDFIKFETTLKNKEIAAWGKSDWGDMFIDLDSQFIRSEPININNRGRILQIKITNEDLDASFGIFEITGIVEIRKSN